MTYVQISDKAQLVRDLYQKIPKNSLGLPEGIYRPDLLPNSLTVTAVEFPDSAVMPPCSPHIDDDDDDSVVEDGEVLGELLEADDKHQKSSNGEITVGDDEKHLRIAYIPLSYLEGFPTLPEGYPFWMQMGFEPDNAFHIFREYLAQGNEGARQLFLLEKNNLFSLEELQNFFYLYYWGPRTRSYDLFSIAEFKKVKEHRVTVMEDEHYRTAETLFAKCADYMNSEDFMEMLTPKAAIDLLKVSSQLQRISAGLPAAAPPGSAHVEGTSLEVTLRQIAGVSGDGVTTLEAINHIEDTQAENVNLALRDPQTAALAQELVIRINQPKVAPQ